MLNHIYVTPLKKWPRVSSAVATFDDDEVLFVDPENAGPSISSAVVPVISGQEQWTHWRLIHYAESNHMSESVCFWLVLCFLFVCLEMFVWYCLSTQQHSVLSRFKTNSASRYNGWRPAVIYWCCALTFSMSYFLWCNTQMHTSQGYWRSVGSLVMCVRCNRWLARFAFSARGALAYS